MAQGVPGRAGPWVLVLAALALPPAAPADPEGGEKVYQRTIKSTAWLLSKVDEKRMRAGTGSLIDRGKGLVVTNYHVVGDNDKVTVVFPLYQSNKLVTSRSTYLDLVKSGGGIPGKVVARDTRKDLALVRLDVVPEGAHELRLARESVSPGQRVHSIGNPGRSGALWLYTQGSVRQVSHKSWRAGGGDGSERD